MTVPGEGLLLPSSRVPGGMVLDEIDTGIILLWKGSPKLCTKCDLVPCERSGQNHLEPGDYQEFPKYQFRQLNFNRKFSRPDMLDDYFLLLLASWTLF